MIASNGPEINSQGQQLPSHHLTDHHLRHRPGQLPVDHHRAQHDTSRLRFDRILDEAAATGGDVRRVCDLFGPTVGAALRYTAAVDQRRVVEYGLRRARSALDP